MPIYEYKCEKCGKTIEAIQKMSDKPLKTHAGCGGKLTKLISAAGFQFKGTGWYVTDYARKSGPEPSNSDKPKETKSETSSDSNNSAKDTKTSSDKSDKAAKPSSTAKQKKS
jgi:putative FmdB family regulatory protein